MIGKKGEGIEGLEVALLLLLLLLLLQLLHFTSHGQRALQLSDRILKALRRSLVPVSCEKQTLFLRYFPAQNIRELC